MGVAVLDPRANQVVKVGIEWIDFHNIIKNTNATFRPAWPGFAGADVAARTTEVAAFGTLLDAVSNAQICEIMVDGLDYLYGGDVATDLGHWFEVSDEMVLNFRSASYCRVTKGIIILAPIDLCFTGSEQILVNKNNAAVANLITYLELNLIDPNTGVSNFKYTGGYRRKVALPTPNVF